MSDIDQIIETSTAPEEVVSAPKLSQTSSSALTQLTEDVGYLNNQTRILHDDTNELHQDVLSKEWTTTTSSFVRLGMSTLLREIAQFGFAWRDVARLIGVSVPALQKWRNGSSATGQNRTSAAALLAACKMIVKHYQVEDVASWFESPILMGYSTTPIDLYSAGHVGQVFHLAGGHADPEEALSVFDPEWRTKCNLEYEVVQTDEGISLRKKVH